MISTSYCGAYLTSSHDNTASTTATTLGTTQPEVTTPVTTTAPTTTTTKFVISNFPEPALDTSLFGKAEKQEDEPQFDKSYFDLEKVPGTNSMSVDTSSFELDSMNFEDGESAMAQTDRSSQIVSEPFNSSKMSPVPIRKVLDIFQELRLSFGRDQ